MEDVNFTAVANAGSAGIDDRWVTFYTPTSTGSVRGVTKNSGAGSYDTEYLGYVVFR